MDIMTEHDLFMSQAFGLMQNENVPGQKTQIKEVLVNHKVEYAVEGDQMKCTYCPEVMSKQLGKYEAHILGHMRKERPDIRVIDPAKITIEQKFRVVNRVEGRLAAFII